MGHATSDSGAAPGLAVTPQAVTLVAVAQSPAPPACAPSLTIDDTGTSVTGGSAHDKPAAGTPPSVQAGVHLPLLRQLQALTQRVVTLTTENAKLRTRLTEREEECDLLFQHLDELARLFRGRKLDRSRVASV